MAVTAEVKDRVGWITLDRPPDNTYDAAFLEELDRCVGEVAEAEVAVAVIRSASARFFSAGADVKGDLERPVEENLARARRAQQLPRLIGRGRALELMTTGRTVTPAEAERLGMVDRLVPAGEFDQAVAALAAGLAAGAPLAVAAITRVVNDGMERSLEDALERELEELASLLASGDAREGMTAAVEKRAPRFTGS